MTEQESDARPELSEYEVRLTMRMDGYDEADARDRFVNTVARLGTDGFYFRVMADGQPPVFVRGSDIMTEEELLATREEGDDDPDEDDEDDDADGPEHDDDGPSQQ